ncbi:DNA-3-methyladenine glycosylase I [Aeromonas schubertii]|uniref:DNA-3-methyladenine glycosylase I n=1 Tax=Aeromonas schubertii TaxID=652 RepID=A0A0S2SH30_9GAMM|nr:DNA-3-methyladenine glycosylase I [Aeromonas schubertii]
MSTELTLRCAWVTRDPEYIEYHDAQWGRPVRDGRELFAKLCLDGLQAGLSWITILKRTPGYYRAFAGFDPVVIAAFGEADVERLMQDTGIIRNRLKVQSIIKNARAYLAMQEEGVDFAGFLWDFVGGRPIVNRRQGDGDIPATSKESDAMSRALKKRGFTFVGSTICYAFMQAVGMVNDHLVSCPCHAECQQAWGIGVTHRGEGAV